MGKDRESDSPPRRVTTTTTTSVTDGWRGVTEDVGELTVLHQIYLAVDQSVSIGTVKKEYEQYEHQRNKEYYYNAATLPISMSPSDQEMYPEIYEPLMRNGSGHPSLQIVFNEPREEREPRLRGNGEWDTRGIRVQIKQPDFLRNLNSGNRSGVTVHLDGYVYRANFRRGRHMPMNLDDNMLALAVDELGGTIDLAIAMVPGLFGNFGNLKGLFTVKVTWLGQDANAKRWLVPLFRMLLESAPKKDNADVAKDSSSNTTQGKGEQSTGISNMVGSGETCTGTEEVAGAGEKIIGTEKVAGAGEKRMETEMAGTGEKSTVIGTEEVSVPEEVNLIDFVS